MLVTGWGGEWAMFTSLALAHMVAALAKRDAKAIYSDGAKVWVTAANYLGIQYHHVSHQN